MLDDGVGIAAEDCGRIFAKDYHPSDYEVSLRSGHGLGLSLAKQIVELHHGTISVSNVLGKESEFAIQFHD